jgi:hypothetical protein
MEKIIKKIKNIKKMNKTTFFNLSSIFLGLLLMFPINSYQIFFIGVGILLNSSVNVAFSILDELFKDSNH